MRLHLHALEAAHALDASASRRLAAFAKLGHEPASLRRVLPLGLAALAAVLMGLGLVFWIAANWDALGRFGRFALLQGVVVVMGLGALRRAGLRAPLALLVFLATGALFAYFGQTYQTGADPWQLFALWAALTLPLALAVRHDLVWCPWVLVAFVAISSWVHAHSGHRWFFFGDDGDATVHLIAWLAASVVLLAMSAWGARFSGARVWALRTAATCTVVTIASVAVMGLFVRPISITYGLGLLALGVAAMAFVPRARFDVYVLSAMALGLVTLLTVGAARLLLENRHGDWIGGVFMVGLIAAGLLAAAVSAVMRLARRYGAEGGPA